MWNEVERYFTHGHYASDNLSWYKMIWRHAVDWRSPWWKRRCRRTGRSRMSWKSGKRNGKRGGKELKDNVNTVFNTILNCIAHTGRRRRVWTGMRKTTRGSRGMCKRMILVQCVCRVCHFWIFISWEQNKRQSMTFHNLTIISYFILKDGELRQSSKTDIWCECSCFRSILCPMDDLHHSQSQRRNMSKLWHFLSCVTSTHASRLLSLNCSRLCDMYERARAYYRDGFSMSCILRNNIGEDWGPAKEEHILEICTLKVKRN